MYMNYMMGERPSTLFYSSTYVGLTSFFLDWAEQFSVL